MDKAALNQHLHFTAEIRMNYMNIPLPAKEDEVQNVTNYKSQLLDMKMSWSLEGDLQFSVFRKKGHQLEYVRMGSAHTPGTLRTIPSGILNRLAKLTFAKNFFSF